MTSRLTIHVHYRLLFPRSINFDAIWEGKVVDRILHNLSLLLDRSFKTVQELNRYRKEVAQQLAQQVAQEVGVSVKSVSTGAPSLSVP